MIERQPHFLLLQVEYREKSFAVGRIPGGYNKREGGPPKEQEILAGRRVDRALRPLFPKGFVYDTQVCSGCECVLEPSHRHSSR